MVVLVTKHEFDVWPDGTGGEHTDISTTKTSAGICISGEGAADRAVPDSGGPRTIGRRNQRIELTMRTGGR
jgi:hypothetical protein